MEGKFTLQSTQTKIKFAQDLSVQSPSYLFMVYLTQWSNKPSLVGKTEKLD